MISLGVQDNSSEELVVTKEVTKTIIPDTTAQIYWLKNRKPDTWRDKWEIEDVYKRQEWNRLLRRAF